MNRYEIPSEKKDNSYVDIDVTLGDNRLNENVVNHYNALNQLTQTLTKNYKVGFTYDAEGLRTSKTVNGEKTVFVWDGDQLVMELSEGGKVKKRYIRGNELVYADKGTDTEKQYYVTDPHGNVIQLTDESGAVIKTYEYDSFGNEVNPDRKDENPFRYCGEYYDKETEEIYLRARYYQPTVGRFLTRDSYTGESDDPLSLHLYTYCGNDGVNYVDPSWHDAIWLQYSRAAVWQGHTGVLLQIKNFWWDYLYWGPGDKVPYSMIVSGINVKSKKLYQKNVWIDISLRRKTKMFKEMLNRTLNKYYNEEITGYIYITGKFKKSRTYAKNYNGQAYNLYKNNCMQVSVKTLLKGKFKGAKAKNIEKFLGRIIKENYVRPNKTYTDLRRWIGI